jgi:hypothetical protein
MRDDVTSPELGCASALGRVFSPQVEKNGEGGSMKLTEGFTGRWSDRDGPSVKRSEWWQWSSMLGSLEHRQAILGVARGVAVSSGARGAFYRAGR